MQSSRAMNWKTPLKKVIGPAGLKLVRRAIARRYSGDENRAWWSTRDANENGLLDWYWSTKDEPSRRAVADAIAALPDVESVLDIGSYSGAGLASIAKARPVQLFGVDLSASAVDFARQHLTSEGLAADIRIASADALPFADKSIDLTVTSVALVCIGTETIDKVLAEMLRVTRRWLVLAEPWHEGKDRPDPYPNTTYWLRDYRQRLSPAADLAEIYNVPPEKRIGHLDSISVYRVW